MEHSKAQDSVTAGMVAQRIGGERVGAGGVCMCVTGNWGAVAHPPSRPLPLPDSNPAHASMRGWHGTAGRRGGVHTALRLTHLRR